MNLPIKAQVLDGDHRRQYAKITIGDTEVIVYEYAQGCVIVEVDHPANRDLVKVYVNDARVSGS